MDTSRLHVSRVQITNMFLHVCQQLFRPTLKVRLGCTREGGLSVSMI